MEGDILIIEEHHQKAAAKIVLLIREFIHRKKSRYVISVAGESGSGKSELGRALADAFEKADFGAVVLGQDDYFHLPPKLNDERRREDPRWLGPHIEVNLETLERNLVDAVEGKDNIVKPLIYYNSNTISEETVDLKGVAVVIAEGTYTSLLRDVDTRIFITRSRLETLEHRRKRDRGGEVRDPFVEEILELEHKIIAGHIHLADIIVTNEYDVLQPDE